MWISGEQGVYVLCTFCIDQQCLSCYDEHPKKEIPPEGGPVLVILAYQTSRGITMGAMKKTSPFVFWSEGGGLTFVASKRERRPLSSGRSEIREGVKTLTKRQGECSSSSGRKCGRKDFYAGNEERKKINRNQWFISGSSNSQKEWERILQSPPFTPKKPELKHAQGNLKELLSPTFALGTDFMLPFCFEFFG